MFAASRSLFQRLRQECSRAAPSLGYMVKRLVTKSGEELLYVGFPSAVIYRVQEALTSAGA